MTSLLATGSYSLGKKILPLRVQGSKARHSETLAIQKAVDDMVIAQSTAVV